MKQEEKRQPFPGIRAVAYKTNRRWRLNKQSELRGRRGVSVVTMGTPHQFDDRWFDRYHCKLTLEPQSNGVDFRRWKWWSSGDLIIISASERYEMYYYNCEMPEIKDDNSENIAIMEMRPFSHGWELPHPPNKEWICGFIIPCALSPSSVPNSDVTLPQTRQ